MSSRHEIDRGLSRKTPVASSPLTLPQSQPRALVAEKELCERRGRPSHRGDRTRNHSASSYRIATAALQDAARRPRLSWLPVPGTSRRSTDGQPLQCVELRLVFAQFFGALLVVAEGLRDGLRAAIHDALVLSDHAVSHRGDHASAFLAAMAAAPGVQSERRGHYLSHDKSFLYGDLPHRGRGATTPQEPQAHKLSSTRRNPAPGNFAVPRSVARRTSSSRARSSTTTARRSTNPGAVWRSFLASTRSAMSSGAGPSTQPTINLKAASAERSIPVALAMVSATNAATVLSPHRGCLSRANATAWSHNSAIAPQPTTAARSVSRARFANRVSSPSSGSNARPSASSSVAPRTK